MHRHVTLMSVLLLAGCNDSTTATAPAVDLGEVQKSLAAMHSDPAKVRAADYSILFIGNSHTTLHDIPGLVARMIEHTHPGKKVYTHLLPVMFLEETATDRRVPIEIDQRAWKFVVLQAQKISMSGRYKYSQTEGIDLAKRAQGRGAKALFYSEWGRKGVPGDGDVQEKIYQEMARASAARVCPVGRAWDRALAERPNLPLYHDDGNHESALGAFLTACTLYGSITGESPAALANFPYPGARPKDREFLAARAATVFDQDAKQQGPQK